MKKSDFLFILGFLALFAPFFVSETAFNFYETFNKQHGLLMSFIKFFVLATLGEVIALRIKTGSYHKKGFGLFQRAVVWGIIGLTVKTMFVIYVSGVPTFLEYLGLKNASEIIKSSFSYPKILVAFSISFVMNVTYAPVMMLAHKISDMHIDAHNGKIISLIKPIKISTHLKNINWDVQWGFVFRKTIPLFWIPAHTITFLLPETFQVLFAALLGIALGIILSFAALKSK